MQQKSHEQILRNVCPKKAFGSISTIASQKSLLNKKIPPESLYLKQFVVFPNICWQVEDHINVYENDLLYQSFYWLIHRLLASSRAG